MAVPYSHLYRVLRADEDVSNGIRVKNSRATFTIEQHVARGSKMATQFISTTASLHAAKMFASKSYQYTPGSRRVARIDTTKLGTRVEYTDLTDMDVLYEEIPDDERAQNFARKFEEVIITGDIPASCIDKVITV